MTWQRCTGSGGNSCTNVNGEIVIDANWRWLHSVGGYTNCFDGNEWNTTACATNAACTKNCAIEGSDYRGTYGITTSGNALTLKFVTKNQYSTNIGSRTYLMKDANNYEVGSAPDLSMTQTLIIAVCCLDVQPYRKRIHLRRRQLAVAMWTQWSIVFRFHAPDGPRCARCKVRNW